MTQQEEIRYIASVLRRVERLVKLSEQLLESFQQSRLDAAVFQAIVQEFMAEVPLHFEKIERNQDRVPDTGDLGIKTIERTLFDYRDIWNQCLVNVALLNKNLQKYQEKAALQGAFPDIDLQNQISTTKQQIKNAEESERIAKGDYLHYEAIWNRLKG